MAPPHPFGQSGQRRTLTKSAKRQSSKPPPSSRPEKRVRGQSTLTQVGFLLHQPLPSVQDSDDDPEFYENDIETESGDDAALWNDTESHDDLSSEASPQNQNPSTGSGPRKRSSRRQDLSRNQDSLARSQDLSALLADDNYNSDEIETDSDRDLNVFTSVSFSRNDEGLDFRRNGMDQNSDDDEFSEGNSRSRSTVSKPRPLSPMPSQPAYLRTTISDLGPSSMLKTNIDMDQLSSSQPMFVSTSLLDADDNWNWAEDGKKQPQIEYQPQQLELVSQRPPSSPVFSATKKGYIEPGERKVYSTRKVKLENGRYIAPRTVRWLPSQNTETRKSWSKARVGSEFTLGSSSPVMIPSTHIPTKREQNDDEHLEGSETEVETEMEPHNDVRSASKKGLIIPSTPNIADGLDKKPAVRFAEMVRSSQGKKLAIKGKDSRKSRQETLTQLNWNLERSSPVRPTREEDDGYLSGSEGAALGAKGIPLSIAISPPTIIPDSQIQYEFIAETQQDDFMLIKDSYEDEQDSFDITAGSANTDLGLQTQPQPLRIDDSGQPKHEALAKMVSPVAVSPRVVVLGTQSQSICKGKETYVLDEQIIDTGLASLGESVIISNSSNQGMTPDIVITNTSSAELQSSGSLRPPSTFQLTQKDNNSYPNDLSSVQSPPNVQDSNEMNGPQALPCKVATGFDTIKMTPALGERERSALPDRISNYTMDMGETPIKNNSFSADMALLSNPPPNLSSRLHGSQQLDGSQPNREIIVLPSDTVLDSDDEADFDLDIDEEPLLGYMDGDPQSWPFAMTTVVNDASKLGIGTKIKTELGCDSDRTSSDKPSPKSGKHSDGSPSPDAFEPVPAPIAAAPISTPGDFSDLFSHKSFQSSPPSPSRRPHSRRASLLDIEEHGLPHSYQAQYSWLSVDTNNGTNNIRPGSVNSNTNIDPKAIPSSDMGVHVNIGGYGSNHSRSLSLTTTPKQEERNSLPDIQTRSLGVPHNTSLFDDFDFDSLPLVSRPSDRADRLVTVADLLPSSIWDDIPFPPPL